jgi:hypothetical protein
MKSLLRIAAITLAMLAGIASLSAQTVKTVPCSSLVAGTQGTVTVTASDLGGLTPLTGIVSFQPTLANGVAASYQMPNGGQSISLACTTYAVAGVFSITLPDVTLTTPPNLCFKVTAQLNGAQALGPGYSCVQPHGAATRWNGFLVQPGCKDVRTHPTQKPQDVMRWAILQAPDTCTSVIDPFMGSGTTLEAAKALGLSAIGIEREERYCEIAAQRLSQEMLITV